MKRFWKDAAVTPERGVALDGRPVRTPGRVPLILPTAALAEAVAQEWRDVGETLDPRAMPLTGLANAAIDRIAPDPAAFAAGLSAYGQTDLLYYRADGPDDLVARQAAAWDPLLEWARARYDVHFLPVAGIMHQPQPEATIRRLADAVAAQNAFTLAALSPLVTITGSLVIALALREQATDPDTGWAAATLDETWQAEQWGIDPLAAAAAADKRRDYDAAWRFLRSLEQQERAAS